MNDFREFVLLQLANLPGLKCRAMFGGYGLWVSGTFFGLFYSGKLHFRTGPDTIADYVDAGMKPFTTPDFVSTNYYEVPEEVVGSGVRLQQWAAAAIREALKVKKKPTKRKRKSV